MSCKLGFAIATGLFCVCALWRDGQCATPAIYTLHIESQPLESALQEFAKQTGVQILFFSSLTDGYRSPELDGKYAIEAALTMLLSKSTRSYCFISSETVQILRTARTGCVPGRASRETEAVEGVAIARRSGT